LITPRIDYGGRGETPALCIRIEACPLCGSHDRERECVVPIKNHKLWKQALPETITWVWCGGCGHNHTGHIWSDDALRLIFADTQDGQRVGDDLEYARKHAAQIIDKVSSWTKPRRWLDVGVGNGGIVMTAAEYGIDVVGLDLREQNVLALRSLGLKAHTAPIEQVDEIEEFDVVSMADVIEHMTDPQSALRAAHRLLKPNGMVFVSCPNMHAPAAKVLTIADANPYWAELEHYHNFNRESLTRLLDACGFNVVSYGISERYVAGMELIARKMDLE
jgi:protein O-GlcNAc transferase